MTLWGKPTHGTSAGGQMGGTREASNREIWDGRPYDRAQGIFNDIRTEPAVRTITSGGRLASPLIYRDLIFGRRLQAQPSGAEYQNEWSNITSTRLGITGIDFRSPNRSSFCLICSRIYGFAMEIERLFWVRFFGVFFCPFSLEDLWQIIKGQ